MSRYFFDLKADGSTIVDADGVALPDETAARLHGRQVARELMRHRERGTRTWRLDVRDRAGSLCFDVPFSSVDESIDHLPPELRSSFEAVCRNTASLGDAVEQIRATLLQLKSTLRGGPIALASEARVRQAAD